MATSGNKVVIRNGDGLYPSMVSGEIKFIPEKRRAFVYDMTLDNVDAQLATVKTMFGAYWSAEPLEDVSQ